MVFYGIAIHTFLIQTVIPNPTLFSILQSLITLSAFFKNKDNNSYIYCTVLSQREKYSHLSVYLLCKSEKKKIEKTISSRF